MNLFLVGYRGSGKSTVGRILAAHCGWNFVDADQMLESRQGRSIREIFAKDGETAFREMESTILAEACGFTKTIVATGGGVILRESNRTLLKSGFVVWLSAGPETLWKRILNDPTTAEQRPALAGGGLDEVKKLLEIRTPLYHEVASLEIPVDRVSPEQAANAILAVWTSSGLN